MEEEGIMILVGFMIVIVVALNVLLVFGNMFQLGGGISFISGFATAECRNTFGGINCGDLLYPVKPQAEECAQGTVAICTNACEIEKVKAGDDRICPTFCTELCLPPSLAEQIEKSKS